MKIVLLDGYTITQEDMNWDTLKSCGDLTAYERTSPKDIIPRIGDSEILLTSKCIIDKEVIDSSPCLKYIGVLATGYNNIDIDYAKENDIAVTCIPAYSGDSVAQFTFALLLETMNHVAGHDEAVKAGKWAAAEDFCFTVAPQIELADKTFGVIGYGDIGKRVTRIAETLCKEVLIYSPSKKNVNCLDELLGKADIISLHCPLNEDTEDIIRKENLDKMKEGVVILNLARGGLINENDLSNALSSGKVSAAGLDVLRNEPPKSGSPLLEAPNCIITPHIAWATKESRKRLIQTAKNNLMAFIEGRELNRIV